MIVRTAKLNQGLRNTVSSFLTVAKTILVGHIHCLQNIKDIIRKLFLMHFGSISFNKGEVRHQNCDGVSKTTALSLFKRNDGVKLKPRFDQALLRLSALT